MGRALEVTAAIKKGTTWGTPVAIGASTGIWLTSIRHSRIGKNVLPDPSLTGKSWGNPPRTGVHLNEVRIAGIARYGYNFPFLLALMFGTSGAPSGVGPYVHDVTLTDRLTVFASLVVREVLNGSTTKFLEFASMMPEELTLRWTAGGEMTFELVLVGGKLDRASAVNTATEWANVTFPDSPKTILPAADGRFRINAQGGAGLGSGDEKNPLSGELRIMRPIARDHVLSTTLAGLIAQPVPSDVAQVTLRLDFPERGAAGSFISSEQSFLDDFDNEVERKADLLLTLTANNKVLLELPRLRVVEHPTMDTPETGRTPNTVVFQAFDPTAAPTGMTATKALFAQVTDQVATAYL
jgi:hypothetical protein